MVDNLENGKSGTGIPPKAIPADSEEEVESTTNNAEEDANGSSRPTIADVSARISAIVDGTAGKIITTEIVEDEKNPRSKKKKKKKWSKRESKEAARAEEPAVKKAEVSSGRKEEWFKAVTSGDMEKMKMMMMSDGIMLINSVNELGQTALHTAVQRQQPDIVDLLISFGSEVNAEGLQGETALHLAARNGDRITVRRLLSSGGVIDAAMANGSTPLHCACQSGDGAEVVEELLENGAKVDAKRSGGGGTTGIVPLHDAVEVGDLKTIKVLLGGGGAEVDAETSTACTALHVACKYGYLDVVKELIARGAYVAKTCSNGRGSGGVQPIHWAVENNQEDVVKALTEVGADVNATREYGSKPGTSCLHLAVTKNHAGIVKLLLDLGANVNAQDEEGNAALHLVARGGFAEALQMLLQRKADPNVGSSSKQSRNQTPLHYAVRFNHADVAAKLIGAGADVNATEKMVIRDANIDQQRMSSDGVTQTTFSAASPPDLKDLATTVVDGYTALHWAVENSDLKMVRLLLKSGARVNKVASFDTHTGVTPLHLASQDGYADIARELLQAPGCNKNPTKRTTIRDRITPLHQAVYNSHVETVRALVENGCDVDVQADNGYSALHYAAQEGNLEIVRLLIDHDARTDLLASAKEQKNIAPLHLAVQSGNTDVIRALVKAGANLNAGKTMGSIDGVTALHQAVYQEKSDVVSTLLGLGADVNASMVGWYTSLHVAAEKASNDITRVLLKHGADVDRRASHGDHFDLTPLHVAAQHGHADMVHALVQAGADVRATRKFSDRSGITTLHLATENGFAEAAKALLKVGCPKDAQDSMGFTALHLAVQYSFHDIVDFLFRAGCSPDLQTNGEHTALQIAEQLRDDRSIRMLDGNVDKTTRTSSQFSTSGSSSEKSKRRSIAGFRGLLCGLGNSENEI